MSSFALDSVWYGSGLFATKVGEADDVGGEALPQE